ncbi:hypothetical protein KJY73_02240 [Bowmanella sp. Y26]|uniref:hypothetical protein n=1 Tax=Bowmanella yangjiangensis TaxID=2811230 RepID=UPI001BDCF421|nr:hypothetical protein [Bowmanella yangjiangensis]MBT1062370.1 hypothetical protein [Bowmanella yangjiangensis]
MKSLLVSMMLALVSQSVVAESVVERGRYLIKISGCNDCHTKDYAPLGGKVAETQWLLGDQVGFAGPWGVSYAGNLRLRAATMDWPQWQARIQAGGLPPMPWPSVQAMTSQDQQAIYAYLRELGPAGEEAPANRIPGQPIETPYILFVPQMPDATTD